MINLLFCAWNRLAYTRASFEALLANTDWQQVARLYVHDDGSTDGTLEWLTEAVARVPNHVRAVLHGEPLGGPVATMNWYLDRATGDDADTRIGAFVKIDNDFMVCPKWLNETLAVAHLNPGVDLLGIAPMYGPPEMPMIDREIEECSHIGGIGLIRHRIFEGCRPVADGRMGWTAYQSRHPHITRAWLRPDMPCPELDRIPEEPWMSLANEYEANGWQRRWPTYTPAMSAYWDWMATP